MTMSPYDQNDNFHLQNQNNALGENDYKLNTGTDYSYKVKPYWLNVIGFVLLHLAALYGLYLMTYANFSTTLSGFLIGFVSGFGITVGAHRLWTHRTFKATLPLRLALIIFQTIAGQNCLYIWVRDHRQHHKYSDTDADPHNSNRGFFFCHIGWLMARKHPLVISKGKSIDLSDLEAEKLVMFQKKYYKTLYLIFSIFLPVIIPIYFWDETLTNALFICYFARYVTQLNCTWSVNSVAHFYGTKPFDNRMRPVESAFVGFVALGEGWHNFHHCFPWDYRTAELGSKFNFSEKFIDAMAAIGWAYDLRTVPYSMVEFRSLKHGDGSHKLYGGEAKQLLNQRSL